MAFTKYFSLTSATCFKWYRFAGNRYYKTGTDYVGIIPLKPVPKWWDVTGWSVIPIELIAFKDPNYVNPFIMRHLRSMTNIDFNAFHNFRNKNQHLFPDIVSLFNGINYYSASQVSDPSRCPVSIELEEGRPLNRSRSYA